MWNKSNNNGYEKYSFKDIDEVRNFLAELFDFIHTHKNYNVFIHQINDYPDYMENLYGNQIIKYKLKTIMVKGLKLSDYATLSGTTKLIGSTENLNLDKILEYNYYRGMDCKALCVVAIPKTVRVAGKEVEYSSFKGEDAWAFPEELTTEYENQGLKRPELHHYKCSLFDAIKKYNDLPNCYLLGMLKLENKDKKYRFYNPKTHLSYMSEGEKEKHDKLVEDHILELYDKYNTEDVKSLIVASYKDVKEYYDYLSDFDI